MRNFSLPNDGSHAANAFSACDRPVFTVDQETGRVKQAALSILHQASLGSVDVQRRRMTVAAMAMNAEKLVSVLQQRIAIPLNSLSFPKKFSIRCRHL